MPAHVPFKRIADTVPVRPGLSVAMGWRHVLFANWPVDSGVVSAHLPDWLTLDTYDGDAWLSVVPFTNVAVRPRGLPASLGFDLPELNLRTYVTYEGCPGVYFFNLDADGRLGVAMARRFHHLPYYDADIDLRVSGERVHFASRRRHPGERPATFAAEYEPTGDRFRADPGSLAEFLTERYRYYTETPGGDRRYARIRHEPWPLYDAEVSIRENRLFDASGFDRPRSDPVHFYSPGVNVVASGSRDVLGGRK